MSAYVEIVFDNGGGRIPLEGDEVVLRRALGVKKDEFFVNRRRVTKKEVEGLLENAGFSRANPYYIVQQGKVNALCVMKDEERLALLKEVGGAGVYEAKRKEAVRTLGETEGKRATIGSVVATIEERLGELEGEKDELQRYERLDREHRALAYGLYDAELQKARRQLEDLEDERAAAADAADAVHEAAAAADRDFEAVETRVAAAAAGRKPLDDAKRAADDALAASLAARADAEQAVATLGARVEGDAAWAAAAARRLARATRAATRGARDLAAATEARGARRDAYLDAATALERAERRAAELSREERFGSRAARDAALKPRVAELEDQKNRAARNAEAAREARDDAARQLEAMKRDLAAKHAEGAKALAEAAAAGDARRAVLESRADERAVAAARAAAKRAEEAKSAAQRVAAGRRDDLRRLLPGHTARGLAALDALLAESPELAAKCLGPLADHVHLAEDKYRVAVEVAAGPRLFHVVVEDDATAATIVERLERDPKLGRLTFMPLNRLRVPPKVSMPDDALADVVPLRDAALLERRGGPDVDAALDVVFGRTLLARTLEAATRYASEVKLDAITLEGDEVSRFGALHGGSREDRDSTLLAHGDLRAAEAAVATADAALAAARARVEATATSFEADGRKAADLAAQRDHLKGAAFAARSAHDQLALRCRDAEDALRAFHPDRVARADRAAADLEAACGDARRRLKAPWRASENATAERAELEELAEGGARRVALQRARDDARAALDDAEGAARALEAALEGRLRKERDDLRAALGLVAAEASQEEDDDDGGDDAMDESDDEGAAAEGESAAARADRVEALEAAKSALAAATSDYAADEAAVEAAERGVASAAQAAHADAQALEEARAARQALADDLADAGKTAEKLVSRRAVLLQRREENMKKMQRVGALPAREVDAFKDLSIDELLANLATCNRDKAKFAHVNKKALDQYVNFADQRALLLDRRRELDEGATAIEDLIRTLDAKKDEAIDRTFRGVSKHFADVFSELVPDGEAKLVMVKRPVAEAPSQSSASSLSVDAGPFVGVQVAVQFPGAAAAHAHVSMNQLSGGQKALVALALVFAIQRCDPAPFYLFDEIDAALDANHRAAVAALVKRQAAAEDAPAQFITTTFRPEFVNIADAHFGISLHHKTSKLHHISKDDALAFITEINATSAPAP